MKSSKRMALAAVLLLIFTLGASLKAHATLETFTFTLNWTDGITTTPESGFFNFDTTTMQLGTYSFSAPSPFGTLTNGNSLAQLYVDGGPCKLITPCFAFTVKQPLGNGLYDKLEVAFAGSLFSGGGTIVPLTNGAIGRAVCDDPCWFGLTPPPPNVPEPASVYLLGTGLLALGFCFRRKLVRR